MKILVKNVDIARELALLEKVVGHKPTITVLGNVLIKTVPGGLVLEATDLEIGLVGAWWRASLASRPWRRTGRSCCHVRP
jgi:DNA polymerase III sliding clamp (beta) subunit (PCNA family)